MKAKISKLVVLIVAVLCITSLFACDEKITVTFSANGGTFENSESEIKVEIDKDDLIKNPQEPTREGYVFSGWSKKDDSIDLLNFDSEKITKSITLYAMWASAEEEGKIPGVEEQETPHRHSFINYISNNDATCTADGTKTAKCNGCDGTDTIIDFDSKLGHDVILHGAKEASCTEIGWKAYETCSRCDHTTYKEIPAKSHNYTKNNYDENNHWNECVNCNDKINVTAHVFDENSICSCGYGCEHEELTAATCTAQAVCSKCGNSYGSLSEHTSTEIPEKAPTCTDTGLTAGSKCSVCDKILTPQNVVTAKGHSFTNYVSDNNATCIKDGTKTAKCDRCNERDTNSDADSKLGHSFTDYVSNNDATDVTDGTKTAKCDRCDEIDTITDIGSALIKKYSEGLEFALNADKKSYSVTGIGSCTDSEVVIPPTYNDLPVTYIRMYAFQYCDNLISVNIPDSIIGIGSDAFYGCTRLIQKENGVHYVDDWVIDCDASVTSISFRAGTKGIGGYALSRCSNITSITVPDSVTSINEHAFYDLDKLTSITIPFVGATKDGTLNTDFEYIFGLSNVPASLSTVVITDSTYIGDYAFYGCSRITSITILGEVTSIGAFAFSGCESLANVTIGDNVKSIGESAFKDCKSLTDIIIPDSVTSIGASAFSGCTMLTGIVIPDGVKSIGAGAFYGCTNLIKNENGVHYVDTWVVGCDTSVTAVNVRVGTKGIGFAAFYDCTELTSIQIPDSVTSIGDYAFYGCSSFASITIPNSVTSIGNSVFRDCTGLTSIVIPDGVISIGDYAFYCCTGLTSIIVPDGVVNVGEYAFWYCDNITNVTIGNNVTSIGDYAFSYCKNLTGINIPDSVTSIGSNVFFDCKKLKRITIGNGVTSIGSYAFYSCTGLTEVHISDIVAWFNIDFGDAYSNPLYCANNTALHLNGSPITELKIPNGITQIPEYAFYNQSSITSVTIPSTVTNIGDGAFSGCTMLTSIEIPSSVTSINYGAFYNCTGLIEVHIDDIAAWCDINFGGSISNPLDYADYLYLNGSLITELKIPDGVTKIPYNAFKNQLSIISVTIPSSVTNIGGGAFSGCTGITNIEIPSSVASISSSAFSGCSSLESITIPFVGDSIKTSGDKNQYPFGYIFGTSRYDGSVATKQYYYGSQTPGVKSETYYIPASLKSVIVTGGNILYGAFYDCEMLTSIKIPESVTDIGSSAFRDCTELLSIEIPESTLSIGDDAFYGCSELTTVTIPDSVISIGDDVFRGCRKLTNVKIGKGVTSIGEYAFYNCTGLTSVTFENTSGWSVSQSSTLTNGISVDVTDANQNATYFKNTYSGYYWECSK